MRRASQRQHRIGARGHLRPGGAVVCAVILGLTLAACAPQPMTPDRALRICEREARMADGVSGSVGLGVGSGGPVTNSQVTLTNRIFNPQSEAAARSACLGRLLSGDPRPAARPATVGITLSGGT